MKKWRCVTNCGACCYLEPEERPGLDEYLNDYELKLYYSLVGEDGWCIHFHKETRTCSIYENRPEFCRVAPDTFARMFGVTLEQFEDFAIDCCHQQIASVYGENSEEMKNYIWLVG
ncbi:MAG: YkgJ family cysteine cluster protein [Geminocystis sp.]|nr:YkgJ family cysteine cluster protein [Geminocystis sp.]HIK38834.1 YkgJ family cysteine cluster protein [Geminocystis sp. M7585_C2015_104]